MLLAYLTYLLIPQNDNATAQTVSSEITLKETGLQAHLTPGELLAEQEKLRLGKFKEVEPMPGAVKLVRHLVSQPSRRWHVFTSKAQLVDR